MPSPTSSRRSADRPTDAEAVRRLLDRQEIEEVLVRFCRGVDRLDEELVRSCFHADATDDHGFFDGPAHEYARYAIANARSMIATAHCITNVTVQLDGAVARSEAYVTVVMRTPSSSAGIVDHVILARYLDRFERRAGGPWLIARRTVAYDLTRIDPVERQWGLGERYTLGRRDEDDLSYTLLRSGRP
jgi:hypothetical protein